MVSSLILFFLGFIYSYYFYKDSQKNYEITVGIDNSFANEEIMYYYVWNSGKNTIYKDDLLNDSGCIEVYFDDNYYVEFAEINDKTSGYFKLELSQNYRDVKIGFDLLRPDEGFSLMLKYHKISTSHWHFQIKQKKDILTFPKFIKARGTVSNLYLVNNLINFITLTFFVVTALFIDDIDYMNLEGVYEYFNALMPLVFLGFLIYMSPVLFRRIKAPRPPRELKLHFIEKNKNKSGFFKSLNKNFSKDR